MFEGDFIRQHLISDSRYVSSDHSAMTARSSHLFTITNMYIIFVLKLFFKKKNVNNSYTRSFLRIAFTSKRSRIVVF